MGAAAPGHLGEKARKSVAVPDAARTPSCNRRRSSRPSDLIPVQKRGRLPAAPRSTSPRFAYQVVGGVPGNDPA
jgi:hypothetical protein